MKLEDFKGCIGAAVIRVEDQQYCCNALRDAFLLSTREFYESKLYEHFRVSVGEEGLLKYALWFGMNSDKNVPRRLEAIIEFEEYVIKNKLYEEYNL